MKLERVQVGDVLRLERVPIEPDPRTAYVKIGIQSFGRGLFHYEAAPGSRLGRLRFFELQPDRLVISNIKGWEGAIAVSTEDERGCLASSRFLPYAPIDGRVDVRWAHWFFLSEPGLRLIQRASPGSADRNRTLAIKRFEALEIPLPSIEEQRHVASLLDAFRSGTDRMRTLSLWSGELAIGIRSSLTLGGGSRAASSQTGWRRIALGDALRINPDVTTVEPDSAYHIAGVYSFGRGMFERGVLDGSQTSYKALHRLRAGQVVMSRLKAWEGALAVVPREFDGWFLSPEFPTFDVDSEQLDPRFLQGVLASKPFWTLLRGASRGIGARRERVQAQRLLDQSIDIPTPEKQRDIAAQLELVENVATLAASHSERVSALTPSVVNRAFGGAH